MRKFRYPDERIAAIVKQRQAGGSLNRVCCENDISPPTFYKWRRYLIEKKPELLQQTAEQAYARKEALDKKHAHHRVAGDAKAAATNGDGIALH